jgi:hypothetical protein
MSTLAVRSEAVAAVAACLAVTAMMSSSAARAMTETEARVGRRPLPLKAVLEEMATRPRAAMGAASRTTATSAEQAALVAFSAAMAMM